MPRIRLSRHCRASASDRRSARARADAERSGVLPEVCDGNKRIFLVDGQPVGAVMRFPVVGDVRTGNLSAAGSLTTRDRAICARLAPLLRAHGIRMAGLDAVGRYLIEVNVTSPGALRQPAAYSAGHGVQTFWTPSCPPQPCRKGRAWRSRPAPRRVANPLHPHLRLVPVDGREALCPCAGDHREEASGLARAARRSGRENDPPAPACGPSQPGIADERHH